MKQFELKLGNVKFLTDSARREYIKKVRRSPMNMRNDYDQWPLQKLISDEDMLPLYDGQRYEDCEVAEKNRPVLAPCTAKMAINRYAGGSSPSAMMMEEM